MLVVKEGGKIVSVQFEVKRFRQNAMFMLFCCEFEV